MNHRLDTFPLLILREIDHWDLPYKIFLWNDFPTKRSTLTVIRHFASKQIDVIDAASRFLQVVAPSDADQILVLIPLRIDLVAFGSCKYTDLTVCLSFVVAEYTEQHSRLRL